MTNVFNEKSNIESTNILKQLKTVKENVDLETSDLPEWLQKFIENRNYPKDRLLDEQRWISRIKVSLFGTLPTYWILIIGDYPDESYDDRININSIPNRVENLWESCLVSCFGDASPKHSSARHNKDEMIKEVQVFVSSLSHGKNIMKDIGEDLFYRLPVIDNKNQHIVENNKSMYSNISSISNKTVQILCEKVRGDEELTDEELKMYGEIAGKAQYSLFHSYEPNFDIFECDICGGEDCKDECVNM